MPCLVCRLFSAWDLLYLLGHLPNQIRNSFLFLEHSTENLRQCLIICLAHLLLAPELVMRTQGLQLIQVLDSIMGDMRNEGIIMLMRLVETFLRALPALGTETTVPILPRIFQWVNSTEFIGYFVIIFSLSFYRKVYSGEDYPMLMAIYLCIMSRVLLSSHEVFTKVIGNLAQSYNELDQVTLGKILDIWLVKMRNVSQIDHRKLLGNCICPMHPNSTTLLL